jgi:hypothetical protein
MSKETPAPAAKSAASTKTAEAWAAEKKTPRWLYAAAKALHRWPIGKELVEANFDEACKKAGNVQIGGGR